jgi:hypothetical protein
MAQVIPLKPKTVQVEQVPSYQPDYRIQYGENYQKGLDIAGIAKRVRADLRTLIQLGHLPVGKYSVTIQRFSGGQALRVKMSELVSAHLILNPERVQFEHQNPHEFCELPQFSKTGQVILQMAESVVNAYNYDGSDSSVDYFNVNFYDNVGFSSEFLQSQRVLILEWMD